MKLDPYHLEVLAILDQRYPKTLRKGSLRSLLSDKNPDKFERETTYLEEHGLLEKTSTTLSIGLPLIELDTPPSFKITARGIDALREVKEQGHGVSIDKSREVQQPLAFLSASFDDGADPLVKWVKNRAENIGFNVSWLKEIYRVKPTVDKIDEAISDSDCIIQILTSEAFQGSSELGWLGNEIGMAYKSRPGKNVAVFVEAGYHASGLARALTDNFVLDPKELPQLEKKAEEYLSDLKKRIVPQKE